jgi:hypothetical protein
MSKPGLQCQSIVAIAHHTPGQQEAAPTKECSHFCCLSVHDLERPSSKTVLDITPLLVDGVTTAYDRPSRVEPVLTL